MRILTCVEWRYAGNWELSGVFTEPNDAVKYYKDLLDEFPNDELRLVKKKVSVDDDVLQELPKPEFC